MKITIELTNLDEVKAVVAALENRNTQTVMALAPAPQAAEVKAEAVAKLEPKTKAAPKAKKSTVAEIAEEVAASKNDATSAEAEAVSTVETQEGDIDDATMREVGGKLLREMNANGKDGVGELTKILSSLSSKKVTEVPMNLRPRFVAKVSEALA
jgi:hypothetical protein